LFIRVPLLPVGPALLAWRHPDDGRQAMQGYTFKEIDTRHGRPKGTAFRAFKRLAGELAEGVDFHHLDGQVDAERIAALRQAGRIYASTVNAVILTEQGYRRVNDYLQSAPGDGHRSP
jgi:hypothetical protein